MWHGNDALPADYGYGDCGCGCKGAPTGCGGDGYGVLPAAVVAALPAIGKGLLTIAPSVAGLVGASMGQKAQEAAAAAATCPPVGALDAQIDALKAQMGLLGKLNPFDSRRDRIRLLEQMRPALIARCVQQASAAPWTNPVTVAAAPDTTGINPNYLLLGGLALGAVFLLKNK